MQYIIESKETKTELGTYQEFNFRKKYKKKSSMHVDGNKIDQIK